MSESITITIRDVPDETARVLSARAAATGQSLQEYRRGQLIALVRRSSAEAFVARVRERKRTMGGSLSKGAILNFRGLDRR